MLHPRQAVIYLDGRRQSQLDLRTSVFVSTVTPLGNVVLKVVSLGVEVTFGLVDGTFAVKAPSAVYGGNMEGICGTTLKSRELRDLRSSAHFPGDCNGDDTNDLTTTPLELFGSFATKSCVTVPPTALPHVKCLNDNRSACEKLTEPPFDAVSGNSTAVATHSAANSYLSVQSSPGPHSLRGRLQEADVRAVGLHPLPGPRELRSRLLRQRNLHKVEDGIRLQNYRLPPRYVHLRSKLVHGCEKTQMQSKSHDLDGCCHCQVALTLVPQPILSF